MSSLLLASHVSDSLGRVRSGLRERCPQLGEEEGGRDFAGWIPCLFPIPAGVFTGW